ncbi:hypothetical protein [Streptomyces coelicoflavus]|uniref:Uncharacterized protein n=1 Tax=Streptomyces coelicoflavus TaxID=285562 RepID=A0A6N9UQH3_9ACTN|nr:hypothetical protein [Streptomyces coelicoflavus]NEB19965.1 hypothetical protein [Streptomyces coelicoflavus]
MALAMSWLAFVGIKGPHDGGARQPSVSLDADDIDDAEQRDDEVSLPRSASQVAGAP